MKDMVRWLERAVIGLNLCPFAKGVHAKGQSHYVESAATDAEALAHDLRRELADLAAAPAGPSLAGRAPRWPRWAGRWPLAQCRI